MTNLDPEICRRVKEARREAGLSQSVLAKEVGCKQSALSMFEQGDGTKLNDEVIKALAKKFSIELPKEAPAVEAPIIRPSLPIALANSLVRGFCPNPYCPSNHEYYVEEKRFMRPDRMAADPVGGKFCACCGEILEKRCPNCGSPLHDGAVCSICGDPYVAV